MKIKLLILVAAAIGLPIGSSAQTVFLYNEGVMSVKGTTSANTVLYINGDLKTGKNTTTHCLITLDNSRTVLTGNFYHNDLYTSGTTGANVFTFGANNSIFEFRGTTAQKIASENSTFATIPSKKLSYINFPTLLVNNTYGSGSVLIDPAMAVLAQKIDLDKGWLVLKSEVITYGSGGNDTKYLSPANIGKMGNRSAIAHLMVDKSNGTIDYTWTGAAANRGIIEVDLALNEGPEDETTKRLTAFGSPFKDMYADYFMWNFLLAPQSDNVFGPGGKSLANPQQTLAPGKGYIAGIDLRGTNYLSYAWDRQYGGLTVAGITLNESHFNDRAIEGYKFNRSGFASNKNNLYGNGNTLNAAYTGETLNGVNDVKVILTPGMNYLSNPYTVPLNLTPLVTGNGTAKVNDWNVVSAANGTVGREIMNRVWVMNNNSSTGTGHREVANNLLKVELKYYLGKQDGGTYPTDSIYFDGEASATAARIITVPPLQMFIVKNVTDKNVTMIIPRSAQEMGTTPFMRSAQTFIGPSDDFIFEVVDKTTGTSDRASVVLRTQTDILEDLDLSNVPMIKALTTLENTDVSARNEDGLDKGFSSLIYTKSSDNAILTSQVLPYAKNTQSSVSTVLYVQPSTIEQEIVINCFRIESLTEFEEVILEDKLTGSKKVFTSQDYSYTTTSKPTDTADRFNLIFKRNTTGIEDEEINNEKTKTISSYYANGTLTVTGFDEYDFGSKLSVYDLQGRLLKQVSVQDFTVNVTHPFASGAYIVKVVGNSSYVAKFLVK